MKVVRFLKRVGIAAIPILAVIIVILCFDGISTLSFNAAHPDKLSQVLFSINKVAVCQGVVAIIIAFCVFCSLMNWAKAKIHRMELKEGLEADEQEGDDEEDNNAENKDNDDNEHTRFTFRSLFTKASYQKQDWCHVRRYLVSEVMALDVYGTLHLDIPQQHEKENDPFWKDCDAFIWALFVDGCARKMGIARKMMREAEALCIMEKCTTVGLLWDDRESEPWVLDWYKRKGYEEIRVESDGHARFLVKDLTKDVDKKPSSDSAKKDDATEE